MRGQPAQRVRVSHIRVLPAERGGLGRGSAHVHAPYVYVCACLTSGFYLLSVVVSGLVLLKFADTITNVYAFHCLGAESVVLQNKRVESVSKKSEFAEIGMKVSEQCCLN